MAGVKITLLILLGLLLLLWLKTIIAGYQWFTNRSRDTMIALPIYISDLVSFTMRRIK
jgi:hypothetical protein